MFGETSHFNFRGWEIGKIVWHIRRSIPVTIDSICYATTSYIVCGVYNGKKIEIETTDEFLEEIERKKKSPKIIDLTKNDDSQRPKKRVKLNVPPPVTTVKLKFYDWFIKTIETDIMHETTVRDIKEEIKRIGRNSEYCSNISLFYREDRLDDDETMKSIGIAKHDNKIIQIFFR